MVPTDKERIEITIEIIEVILNREVLHLADASELMENASATFEVVAKAMEDPDFKQAAILIQRMNNTLARTISEIHAHPLLITEDKPAYMNRLAALKEELETKWEKEHPGIPCYVS